jgi:antitoxin HicB
MHYVAKFEPDDGGFLVTFPTVPEAITGGDTLEQAFRNAVDALEVALLTYAKDGRDLPPQAAGRSSDDGFARPAIPVSAGVAAKLGFIEAFRKSGLSKVAFAAKLGKKEGEVRRMLDPYHGTKLPALEDAMRALGKRFVLTVENDVSDAA